MDIFAHALWAGAAVVFAGRRRVITPRTAMLTVALAAAPDVPHLLPLVGWSMFGGGGAMDVARYANALPGQEPVMPAMVETLSHTLHCTFHSALVAGLVTVLLWAWLHSLWLPLAGWWSHVVIDVFTHSADYYPSPVLYPITRAGFDGIAWNTPLFMLMNYLALAAAWLWLWRDWRRKCRRT